MRTKDSTKKNCLMVPNKPSMLAALTLLVGSSVVFNAAAAATEVKLRVLETSDLHTNIMDYNYYADTVDPTIGLARTASLVKAARAEATNSVLVDNGDLLQGSPMGDYMAHHGIDKGEIHPVYKAMNQLGYAVGNIGNHEFNYGLEFLHQSLAGAKFPYINANVYCDADECWDGKKRGEHLFTPYIIKPTKVKDETGQEHTLNIGYIGFVPPQIMLWDKQNLRNKVRADSILNTAQKLVPEMKAKGADIIIAVPHSGIGSSENPGDPNAENAVYSLTRVAGINAILFGHSHSIFPDPRYKDLPNTDIAKGLMNGIPAVMPGRWGDNMGQVDFTLALEDGKWRVVDATAKSVPIYDSTAHKSLVAADEQVHQAVAKEHQGTIDFMSRPIGRASGNMYSFLSQVQDDPTVQIVADAQHMKVAQMLPAELSNMPVLSAAAPFKAGARQTSASDANQYIEVSKGTLTFKNAADLYLFPNTLVAVKVTGAELKDWLECSANQFNQIDPNSSAPQPLINFNHPTYNFDVIDGVSYRIDITQPSKFDDNCQVVNPNASRITKLAYQSGDGHMFTGKALDKMEFIVATNNYRAFGAKFAGTGADHVVMELPDTNRKALVDYISMMSQADGHGGFKATVKPEADYNWDFVDIHSATPLDIRFSTQDSAKAESFIKANHRRPMTKIGVKENGFAEYRIDLSGK